MNTQNIQDQLQELVGAYNKDTFIYELLRIYNIPNSNISRLQKGNLNVSKTPDEILWKKKLYFKQVNGVDLKDTISSMVQDLKHEPRFVIVTDFDNLLAIDTKTKENLDIPFAELSKHYDFFLPWAGIDKANHVDENPADVKAAEKMKKLFDEIKKDNPDDSPEFAHALNVFLTRLLFCYFAEDTHIFEDNQFTNALDSHTKLYGNDLQAWFETFFLVLDTPENKRSEVFNGNLPEYLNAFPYVNGSLFADTYPLPTFTKRSRQQIIDSGKNNWEDINPDIFGSMFQGVIDKDKRSNLGAHYTSVPNIMKVIEPLFLNELYEQAEQAKGNPKKVNELLHRLRNIKIFDPACGSGNFLIIAYKELRKLEMQIFKDNSLMAMSGITLNQFYGIELDDFAHEIAKLALWLAEHQMNVAFLKEFNRTNPTLPLTEAGNIVQGNACRLDWETVCPKTHANAEPAEVYILGNPPYLGSSKQNSEQKSDLAEIFKEFKSYKNLDYIACWFFKASAYIIDSNAKFAFVSTNSICQGEQVGLLWPALLNKSIQIDFCYTSFKWGNNAKKNAGVTVVIIGLRNLSKNPAFIFQANSKRKVNSINAYLVEGNAEYVYRRNTSISELPKMLKGNQPTDGGYLILNEDEKDNLLNSSNCSFFIKKLMGANEFLKGLQRWCIWIKDEDLFKAIKIPEFAQRIENVDNVRKNSSAKTTREFKGGSHKFIQIQHEPCQAIIIPEVSSESREYIPIGLINDDTVITNKLFGVYNSQPFLFALLQSRLHMVWLRTTSGKLETRISYSSVLSYNNFPFPPISEEQKQELTKSTFRIIEERAKHPEKTLAQLYDPDKMPEGLREAHRQNDIAIERCYRPEPFTSDEERLEYLFKLYEKMIKAEKAKEAKEKAKKKTRTKKQ